MVNEEIMTSLRNALSHRESLDTAITTLIRSGYNPKEVEEASRFFSNAPVKADFGAPSLNLTMPEQKGFFSRLTKPKFQPTPNVPGNIPPPRLDSPNSLPVPVSPTVVKPLTNYQMPSYSSPVASSRPIAPQLNRIGPPKQSHIKEIILVLILLILVGGLILTLVFKNDLLKFFSGIK